MSSNPSANAPISIVDATFFALQQSGKEILQNPSRLLSYLIDMTAESKALMVLERNCDSDFLEPLANEVCGTEPPTMQGIRLAASRMEDMLVNERAVAPKPAHQAVEQLCRGVVRYLGERSGGAAKPAQESKDPTPAPAPVPAATLAATAPKPAQPTHPFTVTVTPPTQAQTPEPQVTQTVTPPAVSAPPTQGDSSQGTRGPSPRTGTLPVEVSAPSQDKQTPAATQDSTPKTKKEQITAPVQPPKDKKRPLAIVGAIAAIMAVVAIVASLNRITVSFDGAGATGSTGAVKTWRNSEVTLPSCKFSRAGYSFAGWDLDGTTYQPGDTITPDGPTTLKAIWAAKVTFNGNGASSGSVDEILALPGETITLPDIDYKRTGYHATGWKDNRKLYAAGDKITINVPITYSVEWGPCVSFDGNGADKGSVKDVLAETGETITLPDISFKRSGYRANGWMANGKLHKAGDKVTVDGPVTYSVDWGAHISFEGNGKTSGKTSDLYGDKDDNVTIPKCGFSYPDHKFKGWATSKTGSARYSPGDTFSSSSPTTLYAVWELDSNIVDKIAVEQVTQTADSGACLIFLFVTNNSSTTLDITGTIDFKSSSGTEIETSTHTAYSVAPGQRTLIYDACQGAAGGDGATTYSISAAEQLSSRGPLGSGIEIEELSVTSSNLVVRLHNKTGKRVYIGGVICYGTGSYGAWSVAGPAVNEEIEPNGSVEVSFDYTFENRSREYFVNGYTMS